MEQDSSESTQSGRSLDEAINLRHYWHVVLERRWLVIGAFLVVFSLTLAYLAKATPIYQATATMQIDRESENVIFQDAISVNSREQDYMVTQYKKLKSRTLIETVIEDLALDKDPRYRESIDLIRAVDEDILIAPVRLSRLVEVKAEHPNAELATRIANQVVENFIELNRTEKKGSADDALSFLKEEEAIAEREVEETTRALHEYRKTTDLVSLEGSENIVLQGLIQAKTDFDRAQSDAATKRKLADDVKKLRDLGAAVETIPQIANDQYIQKYSHDLSLLETELAGLTQRYKDKWPAVIQKRSEIAELKGKIAQESEKLYRSIQYDAELAEGKAEKLKEVLGVKEKESLALGEKKIEYSLLQTKADRAKTLYDVVLQKRKETDLTSKDEKNNIRMVDPARIPLNPVKPRKALTLILGVMGGLGVALGLAFFVNYLDDSVKSQDDIETYLRLPFLGYVPNIKTNSVVERDLQAHLHPQSNAAEGFRTVRAAVSLIHKHDQCRIISVTSTIPSEGKSLIASNLAIVTAQTGLKTLLVDADLRRPSVHKAFQLQSPIGLSSYLSEKVKSVDEFIHDTEVPNLDVVCCGAVPDSPSELVGSKRMMQFVQEVGNRYDRVVLDCPPVSAVSDPLMIASISDGVVFVTKFNKIRREHARRSVQRIHDAGIRILGVVINDIDFEGKDSYYYSYYYYQNRYYASHYHGEKAKENDPKLAVPEKS